MGSLATGNKWEAKVSTTLTKATADQIWPLFLDFFGLHKWFPSLATCRGIQGNNGEPGCVRYCAGFSVSSCRSHGVSGSGSECDPLIKWSKERLVSVDSKKMSLRYEIVSSNIGFESYESIVRIVSGPKGYGCVIEWEFAVEPVEGWSLDDLVRKYEVGLIGMAKKMEDYVSSLV